MEHIEDFLIKEYESAQKLTFHVDEMRSKLTQFFIALSGVALAAMCTLIDNRADLDLLGVSLREIASVSFLGCALLGVLFVLIIARLRRIQIEHFHITNNIRQFFIDNVDNVDNVDKERKKESLWQAVMLSKDTLPTPTRTSGSYFWVLIIMFLTSIFFSVGMLLISEKFAITEEKEFLCSIFSFIISMLGLDFLYMKSANFKYQNH